MWYPITGLFENQHRVEAVEALALVRDRQVVEGGKVLEVDPLKPRNVVKPQTPHEGG